MVRIAYMILAVFIGLGAAALWYHNLILGIVWLLMFVLLLQ